ncbi:major capsid protein [Roseiconus lacunae]|uniref:Major capsid protein n=1 Tax=Roseiconus lacunae TaxID=2605694 RepID=A0ABT7PEP6_9BACT|nr:major capsid protein [Roseiconus lacunae]MDM4014969.1 major capsid protein [Roseiconus lacunae]
MPQSPNKLTTLRPDLRSVVDFDLEMERRKYIGLQIMPRLDVSRQSGTFGRIPIAQLKGAGDEKLERAARSGFSRADWEFVEESYATKQRGVEEVIDDREAEIYADFFDAEMIAAMRAYDRLFSGYENRVVAAAVTATENAAQTTAAGNKWNTATGDPRKNVKAAAKAIWDRTGLWPNTVVVSRLVHRELIDNAKIIERMAGLGAGKSTMPSEVTRERLAELFDVDQYLVADSITLSSGGTVQSLFPSTKALVLRAASGPDIQAPAFGRTFVYSDVAGDFDPVPESYREEKVSGDVVRLQHESQEKVLYPELAEVITGVL